MELTGFIIAILISFYMLAQVTDAFFIPALERISERYKISSDVAGTTLMAMGSSAPELFIALVAVFRPGGHEEIGMGTIVGSALFNILVIIGAASLARKATLAWQPVVRDVLFYLISIAILGIVFYTTAITLLETLLLLGLYLVYIFAVMKWKKWFPYKDDAVYVEKPVKTIRSKRYRIFRKIVTPFDYILRVSFPSLKFHWGVFFISLFWISFLSWVLVESAIKLSYAFQVPEAIIALTVLAVGTSVPDLISSYLVAKDGKGGMAVSNAIGSNIFDVLVGLGLPWFIALVFLQKEVEVLTQNLFTSVVLLFGSVIIVFVLIALRKWVIKPQTGFILIGIYIAYLVWQVWPG
ncbi:MAG: calcium/sodium antiporter [Bacteroidota bacterium]